MRFIGSKNKFETSNEDGGMTVQDVLAEKKKRIEGTLQTLFEPEETELSVLYESMNYSLLAGGKRIRPILFLLVLDVLGAHPQGAMTVAAAIECVHTYSLIHDDLPQMDDDDYRRGRLTNHKVYGAGMATMAGDGLLTLAFETALLDGNGVLPENKIRAVRTLASLAGIGGMVGGQVLDLQAEKTAPDYDKIKTIDSLKTGALIKAAVLLGCFAANVTDEAKLAAAQKYAECIGFAFQIVDDILDVTSDTETLGKPVGSDIKNEKVTYVSLLGIEASKQTVEQLTNEALEALKAFDGEKSEFLKNFAISLADRKK